MDERDGGDTTNLPGRSSSDDFQSLVTKAVADSMASVSTQISSLFDAHFDSFKKQFAKENSSSVEAAVKRARRNPYVFKSKGNKQQFEHAESVLEKFEGVKGALSVNAISKAKTAIEQGMALVSKRMKLIKITDKSQYSWATVQEYLLDEVASDSDDGKRLFRSEKGAEKKVKESKKKKRLQRLYRYQPYPYSNPDRRASSISNVQSDSRHHFTRGSDVRGQPLTRQIGPCFKLSINL